MGLRRQSSNTFIVKCVMRLGAGRTVQESRRRASTSPAGLGLQMVACRKKRPLSEWLTRR